MLGTRPCLWILARRLRLSSLTRPGTTTRAGRLEARLNLMLATLTNERRVLGVLTNERRVLPDPGELGGLGALPHTGAVQTAQTQPRKVPGPIRC